MENLGLYFHIPYCVKKCRYCSFASGTDFLNVENYFNAVNLEIKNFTQNYDISKYLVDTIFIGGGTPSCVDAKLIAGMLKCASDNFIFSQNAEISIECNPESVDGEKLDLYLKSGINRISLGVQSLNDDILKTIGRIHDAKTALDKLNLIKRCGFENINCDIMLNLPGQKMQDVLNDVDILIKNDIKHISAYSLSLEEGTSLFYDNVKLDEDYATDIYEALLNYLEGNGIYRYEVSNFCKADFECRHNLKYWKRHSYIGFGAAAHSFFDEERWENVNSAKDYILKLEDKKGPAINRQKVAINDREFEYLICNLRLIKGFNLNEFKKIFNIDFVEKYSKKLLKLKQFLEIDETVKIKKDSFYILNSILSELTF